MSARSRFRSSADGVVVRLPAREREILGELLVQLRELLMVDDDPTLRRLKPPARPDSDDAEADYREMIDDQLLEGRLAAIDLVESGLAGATLGDEELGAWMHTLNGMRLILGERLSLEGADLAAHEIGQGPVGAMYEWLGALLEQLVAAAMPSLPDPTG